MGLLLLLTFRVRRNPRLLAQTVLRGCLWMTIALALMQPRISRESSIWDLVALVDVSASMSEDELLRAENLVGQWRENPRVGRLFCIAFARTPVLVDETKPGSVLNARHLMTDREATDLASALQFAKQFRRRDRPLKIVLFSDGAQTQGDWMAEVLDLQRQEIPLYVFSPPSPSLPDLQVKKLDIPQVAYPNQWIVPEVVLSVDGPASPQCDVHWDGRLLDSLRLDLDPGRHRIRLPRIQVAEPSALLRIQCTIETDRHPENNQLVEVIKASNPAAGLYVNPSNTSTALPPTVRAMRAVVRYRSASSLSASEFDASPDIIYLEDFPLGSLGKDEIGRLDAFVRGGGGLLISGSNSFRETPAEELAALLPVEWQEPPKLESPSVAWVLAVDKSGSMTGGRLDLAKAGALGVLTSLSSDERVALLGFDSTPHLYLPFQQEFKRTDIIGVLRRIEADGGTDIYSALVAAYDVLKPPKAVLKHILLLTDGRSHRADYSELFDRLVSEKVTLSCLAVGADADQELCARLAQWGGGRFYYTDTPHRIPRIFEDEKMNLRDEARRELQVQLSPGTLARWLIDLDWDSAPELKGYVRVAEKAESRVLLQNQEGHPVLTVWHHGLGQVGVFATDLSGSWAEPWMNWTSFTPFLTGLAHELTASGRKIEPRLVRNAGEVFFQIADGGLSHSSDPWMQGRVDIRNPGGEEFSRLLLPSHADRLQARLPLDGEGIYDVRIESVYHSGRVDVWSGSLALPYPEEYSIAPKTELLRQASQWTGGEFILDSSQVVEGKSIAELALWPWLLGVAVVLLWLELWGRRWNWTLPISWRG